uniref:Ig-like domain-containing protein n=1 Tax=Pundamilia nyererei TaxID=303518 RepID=A0A3B4FRK4_9CICH
GLERGKSHCEMGVRQMLSSHISTIWSKVYLGESVLLKCTVESNSTAQWGFEWDKPKTVLTLNPRHVVSNDSYFITAVTREDAGSYRCKAGQTSSQPVELIVSGEQLQHLLYGHTLISILNHSSNLYYEHLPLLHYLYDRKLGNAK